MVARWSVTSILPSPDMCFVIFLEGYAQLGGLSPSNVRCCAANNAKGWRQGDWSQALSRLRDRCGRNASQCTLEHRAAALAVIEATDQIGRLHGWIPAEHTHEVGGEIGLGLPAR